MNRKEKYKDQLAQWVVWKLPHRIIYWATIRAVAHATQGPYSEVMVPSVSVMDVLDRWENQSEEDGVYKYE